QEEDGIRDGHVTGVQTCALPIYQFGSAGLVTVEMNVNQVFHHLSLATLNPRHIYHQRSNSETKFRPAPGERGHFGTVNHVLARKAGDIGTRSANHFALNDGGPMTCFCHRPSQVFSGFSTSDD